MNLKYICLLVVIIVVTCITGCGGSDDSGLVTFQQFSEIRNGMKYDEVVAILGRDPDSRRYPSHSNQYYCSWRNDGLKGAHGENIFSICMIYFHEDSNGDYVTSKMSNWLPDIDGQHVHSPTL
jgi:hypothetical protein